MKILFYVEPHGLRDSFAQHAMPFDVFRGIARDLSRDRSGTFDGVEARVFANHFLPNMDFPKCRPDWDLVLQPDVAEQRMIEDTARMWRGQGIRDWISLMTDPEAEVTQNYVRLLHRIKRTEFDFDVIVSWGENMAVRQAARELGAQVAFFELASMRAPFPKALLLDPVGVNGAASVAHLDITQIASGSRALPVDVLFTLLNEEFAQGKQNSNLPLALLQPLPLEVLEFLTPVRKTALVPLQLADDANQLLYSNHSTVEAFVEAAVEPLLQAGFQVILKPHPQARLRGGYVMSVQRRVMARYADRTDVMVLPEHSDPRDYLPLLRAVDLVVTNNSSAGFEALMVGTQAVALGQACYAPKGGLPTLEQAMNSMEDKALAATFAANADVIATHMLGCAFPLQRRLAHELVARLRHWDGRGGDPGAWIGTMSSAVGWTTWHQSEFLRTATGVDHVAA